MGRSLAVAASLGLIVLSACGQSAAQKEQAFKELLQIHFSALNNEAEQLKMDAKVVRANAGAPLSLGQQFSSYHWHPDGVILEDVECSGCGAKHTVVTYRGEAILCPSCGSRGKAGRDAGSLIPGGRTAKELEAIFPGKVKAMFEPKADLRGDRVAIVRYVRRHWTMDNTARVDPAALKRGTTSDARSAVEILDRATTGERGSYYADGFHRLDSTFVGTAAFVYDGDVHRMDRASLDKLIAGGAVDAKAMRLGGSASVETPVRVWTTAPVKVPGKTK